MAKTQTSTLEVITVESVLNELTKIEKAVENLKLKILKSAPKYGSHLWWKQALEESKKEFAAGHFYKADNVEDLLKELHK